MNKESFSVIKNYSFSICLSALTLLLGGLIYILGRSSNLVFFHWLKVAGFGHYFKSMSQNSLHPDLPKWLVFSFPNGLWAFAYALLITGIWFYSRSRLRYFWMSSIPALIIGFEVLQYTGLIPGIFSFQDVIFGIAGLLIGITVGIKTIKPKENEKAID